MLLPIIVVIITFLIVTRFVNKNRDDKIGWKADKKDDKTFIYAEKIEGKWEEIEIERGYHLGSFYPNFKDKEAWKNYPNWAYNRDSIIKKVLIRFDAKKIDKLDEIGKE